MKIIAIVQARMGSTRLPNKVMKLINNTPMIELLLKRLSRSTLINEIMVATSDDHKNIPLVEHIKKLGFGYYQGSENNVLDRYYQAAKKAQADVVIRITGDCPLVDAELVDQVIQGFLNAKVDYYSNVNPPSYPDGLDIEVFSLSALERAWKEAITDFDKEHVTPYLRNSGLFSQKNTNYTRDLSNLRWTVDEPHDFEVIQNVFNHFYPNQKFSWLDVLVLQKSEPKLFIANQTITRNEGSTMGTGQKLWKRAKELIPGGNMLLSKRAEMFLPEKWPAYYSKTQGCKVWDLDGNEFIDMSLMGIGTNTLGYNHPEVDAVVHDIVNRGNLSTLNCPEEVYLAEKLVELHPWADMVRFARSGGEANAIAIRIARAASGRDKVAICGYHGWHDWYLSANLGDDKNLAGHLLPGLEPNGVPQDLRGSVLPFNYNNYQELVDLVNHHDIGVIKMEVSRNKGPEDNFLHKVRQLATEKGIVLIFDECTSGFRQSYGGLHLIYGVEPDMAVFGKTLGNGYAITSVIGRREIMQAAQTTFISSTFWTERIGPAAALKTLEVMQKTQSWEQITQIGLDIGKRWKQLSNIYELPINTFGLPALTGFSFVSENALKYKTLITQEMLKRGYLASTAVYTCIAHTPEIIDNYFETIEPIFAQIKECEEGRNIDTLLEGPVCHAGFKRLN